MRKLKKDTTIIYDGKAWHLRGGYYLSQNNKRLHVYIYEQYYKCSILPGYVIHHKNEIKTDNHIDNLVLMTNAEHLSLHHKGQIITPEHRAIISKTNKGNSYNKGRIHTEEARRNMAIANTGKGLKPTTIEQQQDALIMSRRKFNAKYGLGRSVWDRLRKGLKQND